MERRQEKRSTQGARMSAQRSGYDSINDAPIEHASSDFSPSYVSLSGWKVKAAVATTLITAIWLLAIIGSTHDNNATLDPTSPLGWQQQQPLTAEFPTTFSEALVLPEERFSADGELRTVLSVAPFTTRPTPLAPPLNVRAYEGSVPGPTLRIKPGDTLVVNLSNMLDTPEGAPQEEDGGAFEGKIEAWPNVTNLHVHGMHVSPSGVADNVYRRAGPSDNLEYVYDLPSDHYPGTFYYHPHYDGSSSVQTLGGMSGAIVVEDPPGSLSPPMEAMREVMMVLQETNIESGSLRNYEAASKIAGSEMPLYGDGTETQVDMEAEEGSLLHFVTVNGQYQPVLHAQPGEVIRVRLVHGGNNDHMHVSLRQGTPTSSLEEASGEEMTKKSDEKNGHSDAESTLGSKATELGDNAEECGCVLLTLARDGVYLSEPRRQGGGGGRVVLAPGSRADVAVSCQRAGVYYFTSSKGNRDLSEEQPVMEYLGKGTDVFEGTLAFLDIGGDAMKMELPSETPAGGRLLQDLRKLPDEEVSRFVFEFNEGEKVRHLGTSYTWYGVNGVQYDASRISRRAQLGSVEEWVIVNQRLGRGEGAEGCRSPTENAADRRNETEADSDGGRQRIRGRRRALESQIAESGDGQEMVEGEGSEIDECKRAGPGKATDDSHPFHLHVNHFQVVDSSWGDEGPDYDVGDWRDTISIPSPGNVTIRWRADDFTGKSVAHCHIFGHSDTGMMMNFEVYHHDGP